MYLLDTNVVSELRKAKSGRADASVIAWAAPLPLTQLFVSVVTIHELEIGVIRAERRDALQGRLLRAWLDQRVVAGFGSRIVPVDTAVVRRSARLHVPDPRPFRDALIAATALVHGMTVVTRNIADFEPTGVSVVNPWGASPSR